MTLLTLYALCAAAGAVMLGTSMFFGGESGHGDSDHDLDGHADVDAGVDAHADLDGHADVDAHADLDGHADGHLDLQGALHGAADVLVDAAGAQLQVAGAELQAHADGFEWSVLPFGSLRFWTFLLECFGLTGTLLTLFGVPSGTTLALSLGSGTVLGWGAFQFFRWLAHEQVSGVTNLGDYRESEARVLLRIPVGGLGKIAIENASGRVELLARTLDPVEIPRGAQVLVVGVKQGEAQVTTLSPVRREVEAARQPVAGRVDEG